MSFVGECAGTPVDFSAWDSASPYLTEVQLYKSMRTLFGGMGGEACVDTEAGSHLRALMNDVSERFWRAYCMEITNPRTAYAICEPTLSPSAEPAVCLRAALENPSRM